MLLIWGKRMYGAADKVGSVSVKTIFGHFWYIPLFPMTSYYVETKTDRVFELNGIRWLSVLFAYLRGWGTVVALFALIQIASRDSDAALPTYALIAAMAALVAASYFFDKKIQREEVRKLRQLMDKHFGLALDPYECLVSLEQEITARARDNAATPLEEDWYKRIVRDRLSDQRLLELAMLRARCDQHDKALQQEVLGRLAGPSQKA
ncbi:hypothetical protein [Pseudoduganella violaceinigra]|uniref:hypothetical protein n=1 Tax=Pseudoduganella violaceinigra TaxID=246602 RepID=UPI0004862F9E|nr:hypothetical protein [Pseudoduganella violaceinigra]